MSFSAYPSSMRFLFSRLSGYSRNRNRLPITSPIQASYNDQIIFDLPPNSKIDLNTVTLHASITTTCSGGTTPSHMPPRFSGCLIQSLQVEINGTTVQLTEQYAHLYQLLMMYQAGDAVQRMSIGELSRLHNDSNSVVMTSVPIMVKFALGFLGCGKVIDTGLTGGIRVSLRLVPSTAFITKGNPTSTTFTMSSMAVTYETINIDDGLYDRMLQERLASGSTIPICYTNYMAFLGGQQAINNSLNRIAVNTQSLDYLLSTVLPSDYNTSGTGNVWNAELGTSYWFKKGLTSGGITSSVATIGSTNVPNYRPASAVETWAQTLDALNCSLDQYGSLMDVFNNGSISTSATSTTFSRIFVESFYLAAFKFCHGNDASYGDRYISGLDTRGSAVPISVQNFASGTGDVVPLTFAQCTSQINVGMGRQIQYVM